MKNIFYLPIFVFLFVSCTKETTTLSPASIVNTSDRLVFKDFKEYRDTQLMLSSFKTVEDLKFWAQSKNHSTLLDSEDSTITNYPLAVKTILNKDSEFEVGDSIIWFNHDTLYAYQKNVQNRITILDNPDKLKEIGYSKVTIIGRKEAKSTPLSINGLNAAYQQEFWQNSYQPCGEALLNDGGWRKHVFEMYDYTENIGGVFFSSWVFMRMKLEWKGNRGGWKPAGEPKEIHYYMAGSAIYTLGYQSLTFNYAFSQNYTCSTGIIVGDREELLAYCEGSTMYGYVPSWNISMNGFISQKVVGDSNDPYVIGSYEWPNYYGVIW